MDLHFELMPKTAEAAHFVWQLRASPEVQQWTLGSQKTFEEFLACFNLYFQVPNAPPLFITQDGVRIGYVTFRPYTSLNHKNARAVEISIALLPEYHGKGLGTQVLESLQLDVDEVWALIQPENKPSQSLFRKAGFTHYGKVNHSFWGLDIQTTCTVDAYFLPVCIVPKRAFIIAEVGSNWRVGTVEKDLELVRQYAIGAKKAGCDAIKFQTFHPDRIYATGAGPSKYLSDTGIVTDMKELFEQLKMPHELIPTIAQICGDEGIEFMSTPFSEIDFDAVDPYVKRHKIASYELSHIGLLERAVNSKKPLIVSTGAATMEEISWAMQKLQTNVTLLQCTAAYPAPAINMNLNTLTTLRSAFNCPVGLSDHSLDYLTAPLGAVALGATVLEKHITLDRKLPGPDHKFAITLDELSEMVRHVRMLEEMLGTSVKEPNEAEMELFYFAKRRIQTTKSVKKGEKLTLGENIAFLRPGNQSIGAHPSRISQIEGIQAQSDLQAGEGVNER